MQIQYYTVPGAHTDIQYALLSPQPGETAAVELVFGGCRNKRKKEKKDVRLRVPAPHSHEVDPLIYLLG